MPWLETVPVEERERFIDDHRRGLYDMTELCERYAVSRKTGYKWLARYDEGGRTALRDRSRAPHTCPHKIADEVATRDQYRRRSAGSTRLGQEASTATPASASGRRPARHASAQRPLGGGLQGPIPDRRSDLLLPADRHRSAHALPARLPRAAVDEGTRCASDLRPPLSRVRVAARDSHRQRGPVRFHVAARPDAAQCVVAAPRHSPSTDSAGQSTAEWRA